MFKFEWLQNLRIGPRLALGFGVLGAFMLAILMVGLLGYWSINRNVETIAEKDWRKEQLATEVMMGFNENARNSFGAILNTDPEISAKYVAKNLARRADITNKLDELQRIADSDEDKRLTAAIIEARKPYFATATKVNQLLADGKRDEAMRVLATERIPALENLIGASEAMTALQARLVTDATQAAEATYRNARNTMIAFGVLAVVFGTLFAYLVARHIIRSTSRLQDTVQRVADGDYSARAQLDTRDELGNLGRAFDGMLNERVATLAQKEKENDSLNTSIIDLMRAVAKLSRGDLTIKAPVREDVTGALADAINNMADQTAKTLGNVVGVSGEVRSASQDGRDTVLMSARGMNEIRGTIQETGKRIKRLGERSQEITGIVKLIDDIAERTSVLALNANMQAAMAGEAGRGFRVVADEVQRLAERSKEATDQIAKLVTSIQAETNDTMATMDRAIGEVVKGGEMAEKAAQQVTHLDELGGALLESVETFTLPDEYRRSGAAAGRRAA